VVLVLSRGGLLPRAGHRRRGDEALDVTHRPNGTGTPASPADGSATGVGATAGSYFVWASKDGLHAFAADTPASSGIMILEYVAQSAVADLRRFATPAALGSAVLSRGVEEHAGFSTQSARASTDAVAAYRARIDLLELNCLRCVD